MTYIEKRLRASIALDAINGDSFDRDICGKQMLEAADAIDLLKRELEHLTSKSIISAVRVPKGYVIENQGPAIRVAAPDGKTDLLWPGDVMYPLVKPLAVAQESQP